MRLSLEAGCHIAGQRTEGDVVRARNGSWRFEAYEIEDRYLIEGAMALQRDPVGEVMGVRVAPTDGLEMTSYPGLSCASSFAFERLDTIAGQGEDRLRASFDARKSDSDKTITLRVPEAAPLRWTKGGECVCPAAGGRLRIALSDAFGLGGRGEVAVAYGRASGGR